VTLTSGFFASKTLGLDLNPMEAKSNYGMRDEQENYKYINGINCTYLNFPY